MQTMSNTAASEKRKSMEPSELIKKQRIDLLFQSDIYQTLIENEDYTRDLLSYFILHSLNTENGAPSLIPLLIFTLKAGSVTIERHTLSLPTELAQLDEKEFIKAITINTKLNNNIHFIADASKTMLAEISINQNNCLSLFNKNEATKQSNRFEANETFSAMQAQHSDKGKSLVDIIIMLRKYLHNLDNTKSYEYNLEKFCSQNTILKDYFTDTPTLTQSPLLLAEIILTMRAGNVMPNIDLTTPNHAYSHYEIFFTGIKPQASTITTISFLKSHFQSKFLAINVTEVGKKTAHPVSQELTRPLLEFSKKFLNQIIQLSLSDSTALNACRTYILGKKESNTTENYAHFFQLVKASGIEIEATVLKLKKANATIVTKGFNSTQTSLDIKVLESVIPFIMKIEPTDKPALDFFLVLKNIYKDIPEDVIKKLKEEWKEYVLHLSTAIQSDTQTQLSTIAVGDIFKDTLSPHFIAINSTLDNEFKKLATESEELALIMAKTENKLSQKNLELVKTELAKNNTEIAELIRKNRELTASNEALIDKNNKLETENSLQKEEIAKLKAEKSEIEEKLSDIKEHFEELPADLTAYEIMELSSEVVGFDNPHYKDAPTIGLNA